MTDTVTADWGRPGAIEPQRSVYDGPLPQIGQTVIHHLRDGQWMARRNCFPAMVMSVDETTGRVDLIITRGLGDQIDMKSVPPKSGAEAGWTFLTANAGTDLYDRNSETAALADKLEALTMRVDLLTARIEQLDFKPKRKYIRRQSIAKAISQSE